MTTGAANIDVDFNGSLDAFNLDAAFRTPMHGITALFGPSGCGKTSVLRCMAGLQRLPGRLSVADEVWQDSARGKFLPPHRRPVGYVFQEASLFAHLSVRANLLYGASRAARSGRGETLFFDDVVELLGLAPLLERAPRALSGGERQRVAVGRALLSRPALLLMDEPLAALDLNTKDEILPYLEALHESLAVPIIYVSHDVAEVARLADRIVVMSTGRIVDEGEVGDVLERLDLHGAADRFEAGVVLTARVVSHDENYQLTHIEHRGQELVIPKIAANAGDEIRLRVRARDVSIATHMPTGISVRNILSGTVAELREEAGTAFAEVFVDVGGVKIRSRITRAATADLGLAKGQSVYALIKSITFERHPRVRQ